MADTLTYEEAKIEHRATLTGKNDQVTVTKADGDVTIYNNTNKGTDRLVFNSTDYSHDNFSAIQDPTNKRDLVLQYKKGNDTQSVTIKNYFTSNAATATKSSVKTVTIGDEDYDLSSFLTKEINAAHGRAAGTMFNDVITGTDKADRITTGAGDDTITAGKGNDTITINGAGTKKINISDLDGNDKIVGVNKANEVDLAITSVDTAPEYKKNGNDLVIKRDFYTKADGTATTAAKETISNGDAITNPVYKYTTGEGENTKTVYTTDATKVATKVNLTETAIYSHTTDGVTTYNTTEKDGTKVTEGNIYSYKSGEDTLYTDDATKAVTAETGTYYYKDGKEGNEITTDASYEKDTEKATETTTVKDYFKKEGNADILKVNGSAVTDVTVDADKRGRFIGGFANDTMISTGKNETMTGGAGKNTYVFNTDLKTSFGTDTVNASGELDTLQFAADSKLKFDKVGNNAVITVKDSDGESENDLGKVIVKNAYTKPANVKVQIGDAVATDLADSLTETLKQGTADAARKQNLKGTALDDVMTLGTKNDTVTTGAGKDTITTGTGNATITVNGEGAKTVNITSASGDTTIKGIATKNATVALNLDETGKTVENAFTKKGNDLVIESDYKAATNPAKPNLLGEDTAATDTKTTTTVKGYFADAANKAKLTGVDVKNVAVSGRGKIVGGFTDDIITGSAKADKITTGAGKDVITAGLGNDTITIDGDGAKTINIANVDGNDTIVGADKATSVNIAFADKNAPALEYERTGNDLVILRSYTEGEGEKAVSKEAMTTVKNYFKDGTLANTLTNVQVNGGNIDLTGIAWNGTKKADTFTVSDLSESVYIADKGGKDTLNFTDTTVKASDMKYAFNVEFNKKGNAVATDGLVITNADGLEAIAWKNGKADIDNGVIVEDYFGKGKVENVNVTVKNDEVTVGSDKYYTNKKGNIINADAYAKLSKKAQKGYSDLVLGKGDNLYSYKNGDKTVYTTDATRLSSVSDVTSNISAITNDVGNFLKANDYESAAEVLASTDDNAATQIAALKEIYNTGKNEYEFSAGDALYKKGKTTTTDAAAVATKAKGTFYTDGTAITKSATRSVKNNDVTVTTDAYYQSGTTIIAKDDYDKLTDKTGYTTVETSTKLYSYEDADGKTVYTTSETRTVDNEKVTGKVYSYTTGTGKDATTVYTTDATVAAAQWLTGSNKAQSVKDMAGNDTYTVDKTFDFTKDSLVISDMDGDNDVLNLSDSSDKYTVLFDVTAKKDGDTEGTSYVGKALYAIGKDQKDLAHGIQMTGIDKVNANGTEVTMADEIVSKVQSWLSNTENGKSAYASVADALADKNVNVADLIAAYAPQTTTGA